MSQELCIFANSPNYLNRFETIKIIVMMKNVLKKFIFLLFSFVISTHIFGQLPEPAMVGYWESWKDLKLKTHKYQNQKSDISELSSSTSS